MSHRFFQPWNFHIPSVRQKVSVVNGLMFMIRVIQVQFADHVLVYFHSSLFQLDLPKSVFGSEEKIIEVNNINSSCVSGMLNCMQIGYFQLFRVKLVPGTFFGN